MPERPIENLGILPTQGAEVLFAVIITKTPIYHLISHS